MRSFAPNQVELGRVMHALVRCEYRSSLPGRRVAFVMGLHHHRKRSKEPDGEELTSIRVCYHIWSAPAGHETQGFHDFSTGYSQLIRPR